MAILIQVLVSAVKWVRLSFWAISFYVVSKSLVATERVCHGIPLAVPFGGSFLRFLCFDLGPRLGLFGSWVLADDVARLFKYWCFGVGKVHGAFLGCFWLSGSKYF